jgi:hypothetical protein
MRWFRRHRTEPTEMERRLNLRPEALKAELATWLEKHPELDDANPAKQLAQWLRETWEDAVSGPALGRLSDGTTPRNDPAQDDWPDRRLPESLARGLVALLATPFLLLVVLVVGCWLKASGKLTAAWISGEGDRPASTSPGPAIKVTL